MQKQQKQGYLTQPLFPQENEQQKQNLVKFKGIQTGQPPNQQTAYSYQHKQITLNRRSQSNEKTVQARQKKSLNFQFPNEYYYEGKKVKPGISLYKTILQTQERRIDDGYKGPQLNLPIPDTFVCYDNTYYLVGYNYDTGRLGIQKNLNFMQYLAYFKKFIDEGMVQPSGVILNGNGINIDRTIVMSNDVSLKSFPKNENQVVSKYVMPYRFYPNKLRLFFYPKGTRTIKKNLAYKIVNKIQMTEELFKRKYKLEHHFFVVTEKQENLNVNIMHGNSIYQCEKMAQSLTQYLQKAKNVKIFELVIDFVVDQDKVIWFSQVKSIKSKGLTAVWQVGTVQQIEAFANQKNSVIPCGLCEIMFQRQEIKRLVTNKLIYELLTHLKIRGVESSFTKMKKKFEGLTNVCDICYQLIVAQHTLIDVEREFCKMMNMGDNCIERVPSKATKTMLKPVLNNFCENIDSCSNQVQINISKGILTSKSSLLQWRMIIFVHKVKNIKNVIYQPGEKLEIEMEIKNGKLKDKFQKKLDSTNSNIDGMMGQTRFKSSIVSSGRRLQNSNFHSNQNSNHQSQSNLKISNSRTTVSNYNNFKDSKTDKRVLCDLGNDRLSDRNQLNFNSNDASLWKDTTAFMGSRATTAKTTKTGKVGCSTNYTANTLECNYSLQEEERLSASVQRVKIHTFYTTSEDISKFLENTKIKFSMKYMDHKFAGDTSTLQSFHNKKTCQRHSSEVYVFDSGLKYCNIELTTGLICDGPISNVQPETLNYSPQDNVFFPKKNSNGLKLNPLPEEWMEVFTDGKIPYSFEPIDSVEINCDKFKEKKSQLKFIGGGGLQNVKSLDRFF